MILLAEDQHNSLERAIALVLDRDEKVLWWYRNMVGAASFAIQGWKRSRIHPDFVVQAAPDERAFHTVWVVESKGSQLKGNEDTKYKRDIARFFNHVGKQVTWQQLGEDFKDHKFVFQILDQEQEAGRDWSNVLRELLAS